MEFNHFSKSGVLAYIRFFDSLLHQSGESKNFDHYKSFKQDAEKTLLNNSGTSSS